MTSVSVVLCGVLASCKHIQLAILLQFGSTLLHNRFSVLISSGACNFALCKWINKVTPVFSLFECIVWFTVWILLLLLTTLNFNPASLLQCSEAVTLVLWLSVLSSLWIPIQTFQVFKYLCHLTSLDPHWIGWRDRLLKAYRQAHLHIYFTWRTCIPAFWGHVASPHFLIQYIQSNISCLHGSYLFPHRHASYWLQGLLWCIFMKTKQYTNYEYQHCWLWH